MSQIGLDTKVGTGIGTSFVGGIPEYQLREPEGQVPEYKAHYRFSPQGIGKLTEAITKARPKFEAIKKNAENPFYSDPRTKKARKYADLNEIISATADALAEQGLHTFQFPIIEDRLVGLVTLISHTSGEWLEATIKGCPAEQKTDKGVRHDAQTIGIAITYLRRYTQQSIFDLGSEDDDGNGIAQRPDQPDRLKVSATGSPLLLKVLTANKPSAVERPENGQSAAPTVTTVQATGLSDTVTNADEDGCPLSDEDLPSNKDPLPTKDQAKVNAGLLRGYKQDSRALKAWVEKEAGAEFNKITSAQFTKLFVKLDKAMKDNGVEGVAKLISEGKNG